MAGLSHLSILSWPEVSGLSVGVRLALAVLVPGPRPLREFEGGRQEQRLAACLAVILGTSGARAAPHLAAFGRAEPVRVLMSEAGDKRAIVAVPKETETAKRARAGGGEIVAGGGGSTALSTGVQRTSELLAPIMLLTGHEAAVLTCKFSPDGRHLMSGSADKLMLLWDTFGECENTLTLKGHGNAVVELHWSTDGECVYSASADKSVALWDAKTGARIRQFKGHMGYVNSCCNSPSLSHTVASGSDDRTCRIWDERVRVCQQTIKHGYAVTAVAVGASGHDLYTGCLDGRVRVYDLRRPEEEAMLLQGHTDMVTGISLSHDQNFLISNAMDNYVRMWDVKPYCSGDRCVKPFLGAQHSYEKGLLRTAWNANDTQVAAGSADNFVYVWDVDSGRITYKLPGHGGSARLRPLWAEASA